MRSTSPGLTLPASSAGAFRALPPPGPGRTAAGAGPGDRFGVALDAGTDPARAAAALNRLAFGFRAFPSAAVASGSSQTFLVVSRFHRAIAVVTIVASAIFLLCIMLLKSRSDGWMRQ